LIHKHIDFALLSVNRKLFHLWYMMKMTHQILSSGFKNTWSTMTCDITLWSLCWSSLSHIQMLVVWQVIKWSYSAISNSSNIY